ncbi:universal stress protein [Saccharopolyspora rosea]|uniref:universal stress protein n=1 Tax=Saccharopolyspora rosea TaxID=524884 RepID=UPI0021DAA8EB|nr:universal stress protein [Saccharopolyspora rosea]
MGAQRTVVVGFDQSETSRRAVWWAAREAAARRLPLLLVHVYAWPFEELTPIRVPGEQQEEPLQQAMRRELEALVAGCREIDPRLRVRGEMPYGDPSVVLSGMAEVAELVVFGGAQAVGTVPAEVLAHRSGAPVVVVRGEATAGGPVVVGVDGSPAGRLAIGFAFDFAARHDLGLVAVHAWSDPSARAGGTGWADAREQAHELVSESLAGCAEHYPDVAVRRAVSAERPAEALLREARRASLLVVGSHGRGRIRRVLLGSVSHAAVNRAPCPVAVLRE